MSIKKPEAAPASSTQEDQPITSKAFNLVQIMRKEVSTTYEELAESMGMSVQDVSSLIRGFRRANRYGVIELGESVTKGGRECKTFGIDEDEYHAYMAVRATREATMRPPPPPRTKAEVDDRPPYVWSGLILTCWQPSSPYRQEAA